MKDRSALNIAAVVVAVAAAWGLYGLHHPRPPGPDLRPHVALGSVLAHEAVGLLRPGARLIVIARATEPYQVPAAQAQLEAFLRAVRQAGKDVAEIRAVKLDPLRPSAVPPGDFFDLLRFGRPDDVFVSFLGPPVLSPDQVAALGGRQALVLAVCSGSQPAQVDLAQIQAQGLLTAAVISLGDARDHSAVGERKDPFANMFRLVTAGELRDQPLGVDGRN